MVENPPVLRPRERKIHVIAHDEVCFHANDLSKTEWVSGGEQPLRQKGRGRIVHVSDFIIEQTGWLYLTGSEREAQMKLPPTPGVASAPLTTILEKPADVKGAKGKVRKERKKKLPEKSTEPTGSSARGRTFAENSNWNPDMLSDSGEGPYRLLSFDARRIIYPGANGDPWWDMPQLIAQVSCLFTLTIYTHETDSALDKGCNLYI